MRLNGDQSSSQDIASGPRTTPYCYVGNCEEGGENAKALVVYSPPPLFVR